jgi:predicted metal-dependent hydrolase
MRAFAWVLTVTVFAAAPAARADESFSDDEPAAPKQSNSKSAPALVEKAKGAVAKAKDLADDIEAERLLKEAEENLENLRDRAKDQAAKLDKLAGQLKEGFKTMTGSAEDIASRVETLKKTLAENEKKLKEFEAKLEEKIEKK